MRYLVLAAVLVALLVACGSSRLPAARFANAPIVTAVNDRRDVPKPPAEDDPQLMLYYFDGSFLRLITRALELPGHRRALGVNALDDVPDSTWFTNRIGVRAMSLDELRRGPEVAGSPEPHKPWTIKATKNSGQSVGFTMVDARGVKYVLKFDRAGFPEAETAADAVTSRILWACGFNVPEDHVVYVRREELVIAPDATIKDVFGHKRRLVAADLDRRLELVDIAADGRIRAIASRMLDGTPIGGHPDEGVRVDDPNDLIAHELRRDLRGQYAMFAWLDHVDIKQHNTLDMWVADPANPARHYVKHFLVDFGKSLGVMALHKQDPSQGYRYYADYGDMLASLVSVGLHERDWEARTDPAMRGLGMYDVNSFDPGAWKPSTQVNTAFLAADRFDGYWAAKIMMRFTRDQLRAIVDSARLTDPRAAAYLVDALVARQRATARYWFARVAPIDGFAATREGAMCFDDLALVYRLGTFAPTHYTVTTYDRRGRALGPAAAVEPDARGRTCTKPLVLGADREAYTIVRIAVTRPGFAGSTLVHLARDPRSLVPRVIGVWRP